MEGPQSGESRKKATELAYVDDKGTLHFDPHEGQWRAWTSPKRFIGVIAGTQSGKTSFGPHWLLREIQAKGPGDYLVVTPTFQLLEKKLLPEFLRLFDRWMCLGRYKQNPSRRFDISAAGAQRLFVNPYHAKEAQQTPTTIWFGYADDPESLESATVKAAWLDEAGQKRFRLQSWEAIRRRLAIHRGRALITTTPYDLGWLKQQIYDKAMEGHPDYEIVNFDSTQNPAFSPEEFAEARHDLPPWKFDLFYRGVFTRPAGQIYDSFIDAPYPHGHVVRPFRIPTQWRRYVGIDFGGKHTAAVFFAERPLLPSDLARDPYRRSTLFVYREYLAGGRGAREHARRLLKGETVRPIACGGAKSEDQWRQEFFLGGLYVLEPPISDVEVGINRVYACHRRSEIFVFDNLRGYRDQKTSYSREIDEKTNEPTEKIEDKHAYHYMDAERYIIALLRQPYHGQPAAGGRQSAASGYAVR